MTLRSQIELRDLGLSARIGTYGPKDVEPEAHLLDLTLNIASELVLVAEDDMALVFDYDPLVARIDEIARSRHFQTQERLMTLIAEACAAYPQFSQLEMCLRKRPVLAGSGTLGLRLFIGAEDLEALRQTLGRDGRSA